MYLNGAKTGFRVRKLGQAEAEAALAAVEAWMTQHGVRLHPEKTRIVEASTDDRGFDFLGYRFAKGRR